MTTSRNYKRIALATFLVLAGDAAAFQAPHVGYISQSATTTRTSTSSSTQLQAVLPPMIISGAIKKYKKEQDAKKMPMASREEAKGEAPGLRVGANVWRWPPIWPYDREFFTPTEDIPSKNLGVNEMASMLSGIQQPTVPAAVSEEDEGTKLDVLEYWGKEKADVRTEMDEEAIEKLKK